PADQAPRGALRAGHRGHAGGLAHVPARLLLATAQRVRIVQACPYAWDVPGGVQVHVRQLAAELRRRGHDVLVLPPSSRGTHQEAGVRIVGRSVAVPYQGTVAPISPSPPSAVAVGRALSEFGPDMVHSHKPLAPS